MAYSGSTNFVITRDQICTRAAAKLKIINTSLGETLDTQTLSDFAFQLNLLVKETMASPGIIPWLRTFNTLVLQQSQVQYYLGSTGAGVSVTAPDNWTLSNGLVTTQLQGGAGAGNTSITVTSATGLSNGMFIGVKTDAGATTWATISNVVGTTVTLNAALTGTSSAGDYVYAYTTKADRPQKILEVMRHSTSGIDITLGEPLSWNAYAQLPNKTQTGTPLEWHFENTLGNAQLTVWYPSSGTDSYDTLVMICDTIIQDFDTGTDNPYYPIEWGNYLVWALADEMSDEYVMDQYALQRISNKAMAKFNNLLDYSSQLGSTPIQFGLIQNAWD